MKALKTLAVLAFAAALAACSNTYESDMNKTEAAPQQDIVDIAVSAGSFNTLVAAVQEAGLVDTLKGEGPFTVFAPTDEAFAKIPQDQLNALLADKEMLTKVLKTEQLAADTYHNLLEMLAGNEELYDLIEQIYFAEVRSVEELSQLI